MSRMARPRKPLLSRDRIVGAASALVDAEGLDAVSTRRLAAVLGVSGPSLYNHFRNKEEILDAVADAVSAQVDLSMFEESDPRDWRAALHDLGRPLAYRRPPSPGPHIRPGSSRRVPRRRAAVVRPRAAVRLGASGSAALGPPTRPLARAACDAAGAAGAVGATTYAVPALVVGMAWVLLDEVPTPLGIVGGVLCLAGVAVSRSRQRTGPTRGNPVRPVEGSRHAEERQAERT
ncbi:hypothetical protein SBADM41S_07666 [Streptomyces badius]